MKKQHLMAFLTLRQPPKRANLLWNIYLEQYKRVGKGYCQIEGGTAGIVPQHINQLFMPHLLH